MSLNEVFAREGKLVRVQHSWVELSRHVGRKLEGEGSVRTVVRYFVPIRMVDDTVLYRTVLQYRTYLVRTTHAM